MGSMCPRTSWMWQCDRWGRRWDVANDGKGIGGLVKRLRQLEPTLVVLEATGGLQVAATAALAAAGLAVAVVNPRQVAGVRQGHWSVG